MDNMEAAKPLLEPPGLDRVALSKRRYLLRENSFQRTIPCDGGFFRGQSISLLGKEEKDSVGVLLSPDGLEKGVQYALTAYHVLPYKTGGRLCVMTPAGLDLLSQLLVAINSESPNNTDLDALVQRWNQKCGHAEYGHIGANRNGWRSDGALVRLDDGWKELNGSWFDREELMDLYFQTEETQRRIHGPQWYRRQF
jgi:hypothetical protein